MKKGFKMSKRVIDVLVSMIMLITGLPLYLLIACLIKITDGGPVLFKQTRIGQDGRRFRMLKFRSMVVDAEARKDTIAEMNHHSGDVTFKITKDPRVTWIGRLLRKTSIDEMPQLWNVLKGDMSLVGPRPPLPHEVAKYGDMERRRLEVKPGLTCLWQVQGRSDLSFSHQVVLDIVYIKNRSTVLDVEILMRTIPAVLTGKGAY
jgi:exopolysaccharide biosynthesis polyprenyl glycosylphosphotransferase